MSPTRSLPLQFLIQNIRLLGFLFFFPRAYCVNRLFLDLNKTTTLGRVSRRALHVINPQLLRNSELFLHIINNLHTIFLPFNGERSMETMDKVEVHYDN
jgi:hypothetical protein